MTGLIPSRARNIAAAAPPGPPPTIRTSVFMVSNSFSLVFDFLPGSHRPKFRLSNACLSPMPGGLSRLATGAREWHEIPSPRPQPVFRALDRRIRLPNRRSFRMEACTDRHRVQVFGFVGLLAQTFAVEQFAERVQSRGRLVVINPCGKHVGDKICVTGVDQQRKGQGLFPEAIDEIL